MKTTFVLLAFLGMSLCAHAQKAVLPNAVADAFSQKFPNAQKVRWNQEEANEWEAEFYLNGVETSASFSPVGNWMETETEISKNSLPAPVKNTLTQQFAGYKTGEVAIIDLPTFSGYEIELKKKDQAIEVQLTKDGVLKNKRILKDRADND
ncbi:PepSY-like domain-containing protein [Prolixibacter sp. SD074]|uniref:PepSY-like domain-containing protein n=1 Tax=Prolixibacter sp. SD074 TaxID=2652391 RepID=UPI001271E268|nr:PepSY-like domain-containing protein [Prolixibacter sp. SD074]GET28944.1 hypothetical protein SD074_11460 [Prolixibacter sp. SD074]